MSSIVNNIGNNSDMQAMVLSMFNKINNATINAAQKTGVNGINEISMSDFAKTLEEQLKKSDNNVLNHNQNSDIQNKIGIPAGMNLSEDNTIVKDSYKNLVNSIMESLDENSDGKITKKEMENFTDKISSKDSNTETTGSLASSKAGDFLKNQASNFIQKLIDKYKDNSESILGIFV